MTQKKKQKKNERITGTFRISIFTSKSYERERTKSTMAQQLCRRWFEITEKFIISVWKSTQTNTNKNDGTHTQPPPPHQEWNETVTKSTRNPKLQQNELAPYSDSSKEKI